MVSQAAGKAHDRPALLELTYNFHDFGESKKKVLLGPKIKVNNGIASCEVWWCDQKRSEKSVEWRIEGLPGAACPAHR